jgi:hypothetical protein
MQNVAISYCSVAVGQLELVVGIVPWTERLSVATVRFAMLPYAVGPSGLIHVGVLHSKIVGADNLGIGITPCFRWEWTQP